MKWVKNLNNFTELLNLLKDEIKNVQSGNKVCIIHHDDADGCTSATLMSILLFRLTNQFPELFPIRGPNNLSKNLLMKLKTFNPDFVFTLDVTIDPKRLGVFNGFILDHHVQSIQSKNNMKYINPRDFEKKDEYVPPTSYMIYKLLKVFFPEERVSWIAAIGITEDHRVDLCKDVFEDVKREFGSFFHLKEINQKSIENSVFGELWDMVRSGRMIKRMNGALVVVNALIECKNDPGKFINGLSTNSYVVRRFYENIERENRKILDDVKINGKFIQDKKILVYEAKHSNINSITSFASDKLRQKYPDWIICVIGRDKGFNVKLSIRIEQSMRNIDLVEIVNKIKKEMPTIKGGGHKSAIGVTLAKNDLNRFLELFRGFV
ncbi:MAG: DHHA1 domain-containing protein [Candidatus Aenigmarchaeota archaeon]|nr:DHHA1 domain-containing protein [Candidatus Aenigmarchaeota archaeon]